MPRNFATVNTVIVTAVDNRRLHKMAKTILLKLAALDKRQILYILLQVSRTLCFE